MRLRWEVKEKNVTPKTRDGEMERANTQRHGKSGTAAHFFFFFLEEKLGGITMARKDEAFRHRRYEMFINTGGISFPFITAAPHTARITIRSDASFRVQPCQ